MADKINIHKSTKKKFKETSEKLPMLVGGDLGKLKGKNIAHFNSKKKQNLTIVHTTTF